MADELNVTKTGRCRQLLSKGLYINAGLPPGEEVAGDGSFWCGTTQTSMGPDNQVCDSECCCDATRHCYEAP